jgi:hypothetical protein
MERRQSAVGFVLGTEWQDSLGSAFRNQEALLSGRHDHGEATALEIKWDFIQLPVRADVRLGVLEDRRIQRALDPSLVNAVEIGE